MTKEDRWLLDNLKANLQQLFSAYQKLEAYNAGMGEEISKLKYQIDKLEAEKLEISRKNEQLKIANQLLSGKDESGAAKQKINSLIREIDKCIALLNR